MIELNIIETRFIVKDSSISEAEEATSLGVI